MNILRKTSIHFLCMLFVNYTTLMMTTNYIIFICFHESLANRKYIELLIECVFEDIQHVNILTLGEYWFYDTSLLRIFPNDFYVQYYLAVFN